MTARIAHLSDLHFGTETKEMVDALEEDVKRNRPRVLAVSGDLTQRARHGQFRRAREFLERFDMPKLVVPGNHDIPFYDVARRFFFPLNRFRTYITPVIDPFYADDDIALLGLNTARSMTWKNGRISHEQIARIRAMFRDMTPDSTKALVTHHPFLAPPMRKAPPLVGRGALALEAFDQMGGDLLLCGHLHVGYSGEVAAQYANVKRSIMAIQAGTAISHRRRGEPNAYNLVDVDGHRLVIQVRTMQGARFAPATFSRFRKKEGRWKAVPIEDAELRRGRVTPRRGKSIKAGTRIPA